MTCCVYALSWAHTSVSAKVTVCSVVSRAPSRWSCHKGESTVGTGGLPAGGLGWSAAQGLLTSGWGKVTLVCLSSDQLSALQHCLAVRWAHSFWSAAGAGKAVGLCWAGWRWEGCTTLLSLHGEVLWALVTGWDPGWGQVVGRICVTYNVLTCDTTAPGVCWVMCVEQGRWQGHGALPWWWWEQQPKLEKKRNSSSSLQFLKPSELKITRECFWQGSVTLPAHSSGWQRCEHSQTHSILLAPSGQRLSSVGVGAGGFSHLGGKGVECSRIPFSMGKRKH